ncbi:MAG: Predicted nucleic acid-binding protein, contains PIN domain [uncultured Sulfurovum sp.]|uniref:Predicted nucleic acid-binding protein, contains PIN domain n=1 Tax=uncultured Sulfurovum sp. TaxID=269237 RepID=A0A6S6RWE6_9BACT|nr:MAG: Predicted nucleic acid-binding protein, contains PIN domain [uncultured Sulfurovum sp.]
MSSKLRVVLDTNILLVSISSKSKYHWIFKNLLNNKYQLYVSNEVLLEYEEIISGRFSEEVAKSVIRTLLHLENVTLVTPFFKWDLIVNDKDDNKFVDCYLISNSNVLVSNDKHFECLKSIEFPKVNVIKIDEFESLFQKLRN